MYAGCVGAANDDVGGPEPDVKRAGERGPADDFDGLSTAEAEGCQALVQPISRMDSRDGCLMAGQHSGQEKVSGSGCHGMMVLNKRHSHLIISAFRCSWKGFFNGCSTLAVRGAARVFRQEPCRIQARGEVARQRQRLAVYLASYQLGREGCPHQTARTEPQQTV